MVIKFMSLKQTIKLLDEIADVFHIGSEARTASVIMTNVRNTAKHQFCIKPPSDEVVRLVQQKRVVPPLIRDYILEASGIDVEGEEGGG